jgi:hypothetical protein
MEEFVEQVRTRVRDGWPEHSLQQLEKYPGETNSEDRKE